jgi:hypothetical protein
MHLPIAIEGVDRHQSLINLMGALALYSADKIHIQVGPRLPQPILASIVKRSSGRPYVRGNGAKSNQRRGDRANQFRR